MPKEIRLAIQFVARLFNAAGPKITVIKKPSKVKMIKWLLKCII
jgi:hypothetical protein